MKFNEPPQEIEIEQSVLTALFAHSENRSEALETLTYENFSHTSHQILYTKITDLHKAGNPIYPATDQFVSAPMANSKTGAPIT